MECLNTERTVPSVVKIVSGGQTGVDRAALDAAVSRDLVCAGWCPKGRRAEDGVVPARFPLTETPDSDYRQRTEWNVRDSDATLILYRPPLHGGSRHTRTFAERLGKPFLLVDVSEQDVADRILRWLESLGPAVLNIAGPRESDRPGIYREALPLLDLVLGRWVDTLSG